VVERGSRETQAFMADADIVATSIVSRTEASAACSQRLAESGVPVADVRRKHAVSKAARPHDSLGRVPPLMFLPRPSSAEQSPVERSDSEWIFY
jgi:hypothetical protein